MGERGGGEVFVSPGRGGEGKGREGKGGGGAAMADGIQMTREN